MEHACVDELLLPGGLLLFFNLLEELLKSLLLLLAVNVSDDVDIQKVLLTELGSIGSHVGELDGELFIPLLTFLELSLDDLNSDGLNSLLIPESKLSLCLDEIDSSSRCVFRVVDLNGFIVQSNFTIGSVLSEHSNFTVWLGGVSI